MNLASQLSGLLVKKIKYRNQNEKTEGQTVA
jgi:hypothetical protein